MSPVPLMPQRELVLLFVRQGRGLSGQARAAVCLPCLKDRHSEPHPTDIGPPRRESSAAQCTSAQRRGMLNGGEGGLGGQWTTHRKPRLGSITALASDLQDDRRELTVFCFFDVPSM